MAEKVNGINSVFERRFCLKNEAIGAYVHPAEYQWVRARIAALGINSEYVYAYKTTELKLVLQDVNSY